MLDRLNKYSAQETADAVAVIAEQVGTLMELIDDLYSRAPDRDFSKFDAIWPDYHRLNAALCQKLNKLASQLEPPADYDPADRNLRD